VLQAASLKTRASGYHPLDTLGAVIDHELGHVLDNAHHVEGDNSTFLSNDSAFGSQLANIQISAYAVKHRQEAFAEAFSIWEDQHAGPESSVFAYRKLTPAMRQVLEDAITWDELFRETRKSVNFVAAPPHVTCDGYVPDDVITSLPVKKASSKDRAPDVSGAPAAAADVIYRQLSENYPPHSIKWVKRLKWRGPVEVALDAVDDDSDRTWAAHHQEKHVKRFEQKIKSGKGVNPIVAVTYPGHKRARIIDGHHRFFAYRNLGQPAVMYVGAAPSGEPEDPWFMAHVYQENQGASPANKARGVSHYQSDVKCDTLLNRVVESSSAGNGSRVALTSQSLAQLIKSFNPLEPRDAHGEWTHLGAISAADLRFTDGKIKHAPSGHVIATAAHEKLGPGQIRHTVSHADGTRVYQGTSKKDALAAIAAHHNGPQDVEPGPPARPASLSVRVAAVPKPAVLPKVDVAVDVSQRNLTRARLMTSTGHLTPDEAKRLVNEVARHVHLIPESVRVNVITVSKLRDDQVLGNTETRWNSADPRKRRPLSITVRIRRDLVTTPSDHQYQKAVRSGWVAPSGLREPYSGLKHTVAHEMGHVIVNANGQQLVLEMLHGHRHVSKYGAQSSSENLAEGYAMHAHGVESPVGKAVARAARH
jgi:hypothetical protein